MPISQLLTNNPAVRLSPADDSPELRVPAYTAIFKGNGYTISNLYINDGGTGTGYGLFSHLGMTDDSARLESLGLVNVYVRGYNQVGGLAGSVNSNFTNIAIATTFTNDSRVIGSYVTGVVTGNSRVGGIAGQNYGIISASYSLASVTASTSHAGGLAGYNAAVISKSYAAGPVNAPGDDVGGLAGYSTLNSTNPFGGILTRSSYWDVHAGCQHTSRTGSAPHVAYGRGKTTAELLAPAGYTGIYADWDDLLTALGATTTGANPWSFRAGHYPALNYGGLDAGEQFDAQRIDYDCDNDGLIEINNLADLDAVRHDLDGNGAVDADTNATAYAGAYPIPAAGMGCPLADHDDNTATAAVPVCTGYELGANSDSEVTFNFDTDGDGGPDAGDTYWNGGLGWLPIGTAAAPYAATFSSNGHTLSNLHISRGGATGSDEVGLFGAVGSAGRLSNVILTGASVTGRDRVGAVAGQMDGALTGATLSGSVTGRHYAGGIAGRAGGGISGATVAGTATVRGAGADNDYIGGIVGQLQGGGSVTDSRATATVSGTDYVGGIAGQVAAGAGIVNSYAAGSVAGTNYVGGLAGELLPAVTTPTAQAAARIDTAWSGAAVTGTDYVGGLVGNQQGQLAAAYALGAVTGTTNAGGAAGAKTTGATATAAYFDSETTGQTASPGGGAPQNTRALLTPTAYGLSSADPPSIYADWNRDIDGENGQRRPVGLRPRHPVPCPQAGRT